MNLYINDIKLVMFNLFKHKLWNTDFVSQTIRLCGAHLCKRQQDVSEGSL